MTYAFIASSWTITIMVVLALIWGQPAAVSSNLTIASARETEIAGLRATIVAYPVPTVRSFCRQAPYFTGC